MELTNINSIPFIYVVDSGTIAIGGSAQTTLTMMADSRFELVGIFGTGGATDASEEGIVSPNNFSVQIRDQTTGRDLMNTQVPQRILCGNAFNGFLQRRGVVFEPQSALFFDFRNLSAAATNRVRLSLMGYKIIL